MYTDRETTPADVVDIEDNPGLPVDVRAARWYRRNPSPANWEHRMAIRDAVRHGDLDIAYDALFALLNEEFTP